MKPIDRHYLLNELGGKVELHVHNSIGVFQNLSEEILLRPSSKGGWSIAQCLEHLNSYGYYYLPLIEVALEKSTTNSTAFYFITPHVNIGSFPYSKRIQVFFKKKLIHLIVLCNKRMESTLLQRIDAFMIDFMASHIDCI